MIKELLKKEKIQSGVIISEEIFKTEYIEVSLYNFSEDELISFERSHSNKLYISLLGDLNIKVNGKEFVLKEFEALFIKGYDLREISSKTELNMLMIRIGEDIMLKNIDKEKVLNLIDEIEYKENKIVTKNLVNNELLSITLLSFDSKQKLATHSAPGDAFVIALDGEAKITIDKNEYNLKKGESIIMPKDIPHSVEVENKYKMLLIVSK